MNAWKGTWRLVRLALRRDRLKLPIWILVIISIPAASAPALESTYPTIAERTTAVATAYTSVVSRAMAGAIDSTDLGSIMMVETFLFTSVLVAFMSTTAVIRHTRQNEESRASELIRSAVVGRYASITAAMIVAISASMIVGALIGLFVALSDIFTLEGSLLYGAAYAGVGITFAAVAGLAAQFTENTRGASAIAGTIIGLSFLIRAVGDSFGEIAADGLSADPSWLTYLSPLAWGFLVYPFTEMNYIWFVVMAIFASTISVFAFYLINKRDDGYGLLSAKDGRAEAKKSLLSPLGLAWRLQKGTLKGWALGYTIFGVVIGAISKEFIDLVEDNELLAQYLGGVDGDITDAFFASMLGLAGIILIGYCAQTLSRLRSEEANSQLESIMGTAVSRIRWMWSHVIIAVTGISFLMTVVGLVAGTTYILAADAEWSRLSEVVVASLVQIPAILVIAGLISFIFGLLPRFTAAVGWAAFVFVLIVTQLAALLELPDWVVDISPFSHLPLAPAVSIDADPLFALILIAIGLFVLAFASFRHRDLSLS